MQWFERMNAAMQYIEDSLLDRVDVRRASRIACCSTFHFQRVFACLSGVSLGEYVRRRRMTLAAADLQAGMRVVDAALR